MTTLKKKRRIETPRLVLPSDVWYRLLRFLSLGQKGPFERETRRAIP
jgi:hypothetical protein